MVDQPTQTLHDLVKHLGRYPEEAFLFVRDGLSFAAERVHGPETDAHRFLQQYLAKQDLEWSDLIQQFDEGTLPKPVLAAIEQVGGVEKLNRHVSGRDLCWSLRDYALLRWGMLARTVLEAWNIRGTKDFGRIVFGFIDFDMMRKQDDDRLEDFNDVFDFDESFDRFLRNYDLETDGGDRAAEN